MATITLTLSTKIDKKTSKQQVLMRFTNDKICYRAKTNIFVQSCYWDSSSQSIDYSSVDGDLKKCYQKRVPNPKDEELKEELKSLLQELKDSSGKLEEMSSFVLKSFEDADKGTVKDNKDWLKNLVHDFNFPPQQEEKEQEPQVTSLLQAVTSLIESAKSGNRTVRRKETPVVKETIIQYRQVQTILQRYLKLHKKSDIDLSDVNEKFYKSFVQFLYNEGYKLNTVGKHIKNLKAAINALPMAQRVSCEFVEPKKCVKLTEDVDNIYLTEEELESIATVTINTPYLEKVRDQFLLLAWTGCRYSDLPKLNKSNIHTLKNGGQCFKLEQKKTTAKVVIPIFPATQAILEKYDYEVPKPMSNQPFNRFLKEVAKMAGLNDEVTITHTENNDGSVERVTQSFSKWECVTAHTARRSFATNMYKRGYPTLMIMKITGHKTEKAFLSYIKVSEEENAEKMLAEWK